MADEEQVRLLKEKGVKAWNKWRKARPKTRPDLRGADLRRVELIEANLCEADLRGANLLDISLLEASRIKAKLQNANLQGANLIFAQLQEVVIFSAVPLRRDWSNIILTIS